MKFNIEQIKAAAQNELEHIYLYGHPSYRVFESQFSECGKFEILVEVSPAGVNFSTGKHGYRLEASIHRIEEGADLESDSYWEETTAEIDGFTTSRRAEIWNEVSKMITRAKKNEKARIAKK